MNTNELTMQRIAEALDYTVCEYDMGSRTCLGIKLYDGMPAFGRMVSDFFAFCADYAADDKGAAGRLVAQAFRNMDVDQDGVMYATVYFPRIPFAK